MVAKLPHRLGLALDAGEAGVVEAFRLDDGDGDVAVELFVVREVDLLATALTEEAFDGIAPVRERGRQCR